MIIIGKKQGLGGKESQRINDSLVMMVIMVIGKNPQAIKAIITIITIITSESLSHFHTFTLTYHISLFSILHSLFSIFP